MFNSEEAMEDSYDWREEENEKAQFKHPSIRDLFPANYLAERERFFEQHTNYDPHFCYQTVVSPEVIPISTEHQALALKILANNKYEGHCLPLLSEEAILATIE